MSEEEGSRWKGKLHAVLAAPLERVWALASDCCGLPKWMPMVESCEGVEGEDGKPGFVRLLRGEMFPRLGGEKSWIREKLLLMDPIDCKYAYSMEDGNIGLSGYVNTVQFFDFGEGTTLVHWFLEIDPVPGATMPTLLDYLAFLYKSSLKKLEIAASSPPATTISQEDSIQPALEQKQEEAK